ncbi:MAG: ornithine cyclodeaminase family protein [Gemmatimonadota bacterium]
MEIRILSREDVAGLVDMPGAIDAMAQAFEALSTGAAEAPLRTALASEAGVHLFMPAQVPDADALGEKVVSVNHGNVARGLPAIHAVVLMLDDATGRARALMDGTWLTALRTGAAGGLAAEHLSRPESRVVALFGAGVQARTQVEAVRCVRPITDVRIVSRTQDSAEALAGEVTERAAAEGFALRAVAMTDAAGAVRDADIIITATNSPTPVFPGDAVKAGVHITAVGSYTPRMQEVDAELIARSRVIVDQIQAVLAEGGDLAAPIAEGRFGPEIIAGELGEVVAGLIPGRTSEEEITYFKSVGNAVQDVVLGRRVLEAAEARGVGTLVRLG